MVCGGDEKSTGRGPSVSRSPATGWSTSGVDGRTSVGVDGSAESSSSEVTAAGGELGGRLKALLIRLGGDEDAGS